MRNGSTDDIAAWCNAKQAELGLFPLEFLNWIINALGDRFVDTDCSSSLFFVSRESKVTELYLVHSVWYCKE